MDVAASELPADALPSPAELDVVASAALGHPATAGSWSAEPVGYEFGSPATAALVRVRGVAQSGEPWSAFVKVLQHPRHWSGLGRIPDDERADFLSKFPWRAELGAWDPQLQNRFPAGLRVPKLYHLAELPDERLAIWMEDISCSSDPWTVQTFENAARLLGTLAANRRDPALLEACPVPAGYGLRRYYAGEVIPTVAQLPSHELWTHSTVVALGGEQLRSDLIALAARAPAILDHLDQLPQAMPHGDASPQNLLVPVDDPNTFVAIDIAFQCPLAVGFDLAQLLIGLVHANEIHPRALETLHPILTRAYAEGMQLGTHPVPGTPVTDGFIGSLVIRAAFNSLPFRIPADQLTVGFLERRMGLTRFIADLGLRQTA